MKHTLGILLMMALGALLLASCGDEVPGRVTGVGLVCASDNAEVGETSSCSNGDLIDFCINGSNGSCYYEVGGQQVSCGNCFDNQNSIQACAQQAIDLCEP